LLNLITFCKYLSKTVGLKLADFEEKWKYEKGFHYKNPCGRLVEKILQVEIESSHNISHAGNNFYHSF
jgi:hypothetical protein